MMQLEHLNIAVRERSYAELYELAIRLCLQHCLSLTLITLVGGGALALISWAVLVWVPADRAWGFVLAYLLWGLMLAALAPLQTGLVTAYIGQSMFSLDPSLREALHQCRQRAAALLGICLVRFGLAVLLGIGLLFHPVHLQECVLLERAPFLAAWHRSWRLYRFYNHENIAHSLLNLLVITVAVCIAGFCGFMFLRIFQWSAHPVWDYLVYFHPAWLWPLCLTAPLLTFFGVFRFCSYIDLRTRREGWELELEMRRAANRLGREAA